MIKRYTPMICGLPGDSTPELIVSAKPWVTYVEDEQGSMVRASDHESALATEREARRIAQEDCATLNALLDADKLIHEDLLRIRDEALAERDALSAKVKELEANYQIAHEAAGHAGNTIREQDRVQRELEEMRDLLKCARQELNRAREFQLRYEGATVINAIDAQLSKEQQHE